MATRGFEFAYMIDGTNASPVIMDWPLAAHQDVNPGDALTIDSAGRGTVVGTATTEVFAVAQEDTGGAVATAGTNYKVAIVTRNQVWRCSMDASSTAVKIGYEKALQFADANTIDADGTTSGAMTPFEVTDTDDEANIKAYVVFNDTTFGNA